MTQRQCDYGEHNDELEHSKIHFSGCILVGSPWRSILFIPEDSAALGITLPNWCAVAKVSFCVFPEEVDFTPRHEPNTVNITPRYSQQCLYNAEVTLNVEFKNVRQYIDRDAA